MTTDSKVILITGASGFLGSALCEYFHKHGYQVRALVRDLKKAKTLKSIATAGVFRCELPDDIDESAFDGDIFALIHCAYASQSTDRQAAEAINIQGSSQLLQMARKHQVHHFVFISSLSAHEGAESFYGQSKVAVEKMLDADRDLIVRPGLIIGQGGLFRRMQESVRQVPVVPLFYGGRQAIQTIWIEDLCRALQNALENNLSGVYNLAHPGGIPIKKFYRIVALSVGRSCHFVKLPGPLTLLFLRFAERLGLKLPVTSENLLGLKQMKLFDTQRDLNVLGVQTISLEQAMGRVSS